MKIGIDASRANLKNKTGTEWYSFYLIQELKKIIPEKFEVVLYSKEHLTGGLEDLPKNWQSQVLNWPPRFLWTQVRMSLEMLKFWSRPNVLFVPAHTIPLVHPKKTILVTHDIGFERMRELYDDKELGYHRWAMRFAVKNAYHMITISKFSKKEIAEFYGYPKDKISVVYNGFDSKVYNPITTLSKDEIFIIRNKYKIADPYILFIGRLEQKKNISQLIKAFKVLKEKYNILHKLVLIGSAGFKYNDIEANVSELKLKDEVIMPGYVKQEHMNSIMNLADLFVLPSLYEGFGIPILEAMSAGTPVACSNIAPLKEVGGEACNYFDPQNINDMVDQMLKLLNDQDMRVKLRELGFKQVKKFSHKKCAEETWEVIKSNI